MFDVLEEVKGAKRIGITGHVRPDGDCIGATLGLGYFLRKELPDTEIVNVLEQPGASFSILGEDLSVITSDFPELPVFDVFFVVDTNPAPSRIGEAMKYYEKARKTIVIDHHQSNAGGVSDVEYIVPQAAAASELVYDLLPKDKIDTRIARLLYLGISHDTGVFRFSNTSPKVMCDAANLISYGFDFPKLLDVTFYEKSYKQNRIMGRIQEESKLYFDGKVILGYSTNAYMEEFGTTKEDYDGMVNRLRATKGTECAVFIYEKPDHSYKLSLRASSDLINVAKVCECFGGGGHVRASGCEMKGSLQEVIDTVLAEIGKQLS